MSLKFSQTFKYIWERNGYKSNTFWKLLQKYWRKEKNPEEAESPPYSEQG